MYISYLLIISRVFTLLFRYSISLLFKNLPYLLVSKSALKSPSMIMDLSNAASNFVRFCFMYAAVRLLVVYNLWLPSLLDEFLLLLLEVFLFIHTSNFSLHPILSHVFATTSFFRLCFFRLCFTVYFPYIYFHPLNVFYLRYVDRSRRSI